VGYLEDPALRLATVLFGTGLILTALVIDAGILARLAVGILGVIPTISVIFHRK